MAKTPAGEFPRKLDSQGLWNAQPDLVRRPNRGRFGPADPGGERAESPVGRGVGIASEDELSGEGEAGLAQDLVADAVLDVEKIRQSLDGDELTDGLVVLGILLIGRRDDMIENDDQLFGRLDPLDTQLLELAD